MPGPVPTKYATDMASGTEKKQRQRQALNQALPDPVELAAGIRAGSRSALARGITLVESSRTDHQEIAQALLADLLPDTE